jgi:hypothetical protein
LAASFSCSNSRPIVFNNSIIPLSHPQHNFTSFTKTSAKTFIMDYKSISTPESCYVDFCLLPVSNSFPSMPLRPRYSRMDWY